MDTPVTAPAGALLCGHLYPDGALCKTPASEPHEHVQVFDQTGELVATGIAPVGIDIVANGDEVRALRDGVIGPMHLARPSWHVETRLRALLGRPDLAKNVATILPPIVGAQLCDRLDTLITQAREQAIVEVENHISEGIEAKRAQIAEQAETRRKAVHDERYRGHSRLS